MKEIITVTNAVHLHGYTLALTFSDGGSGKHLGSSVAVSSDGLTATVGAGGDAAPLVLHWDGFHWI